LCGLSQELSSSYKSFPESKHVSTALQVIQDSLASPAGSCSNNTGKCPGFGSSSFPGRFRSKDFEIHNSSIGKSAPTCDKTMAFLLGSKSVDGLRLFGLSHRTFLGAPLMHWIQLNTFCR
jgi:hypothetical protein